MSARVFKSGWFAKAARKARIGDAELSKAIAQAMAGQADDLGGGVYKKRLADTEKQIEVLVVDGDWIEFDRGTLEPKR